MRQPRNGVMPWMRLAGVLGLFCWGMLAVTLVQPLLQRIPGRHGASAWAALKTAWFRGLFRVLKLRLRVTGEPCGEAGLVVANHISWVDIVVLGAQFNPDFVAKLEVASWPVLGYLARATGTLFLRRGDPEDARRLAERMSWRLRRGHRLALFPEGTTTTGDRVLRFHSRLFQPARLTAAVVQAAALRYTGVAATLAPFVGDDDFVPHLWRLLQLPEIEVCLHYCRPLTAGASADELARLTRSQILAALPLDPGAMAAVRANPLTRNRNQTPAGL